MVDDELDRALWYWTAAELSGFVVLLGILLASVTGRSTLFATTPRSLRLGAIVFILFELSLPLIVYIDLRRRPDDLGSMWIHVTALPVLNIVGFIAYLEERHRTRRQ